MIGIYTPADAEIARMVKSELMPLPFVPRVTGVINNSLSYMNAARFDLEPVCTRLIRAGFRAEMAISVYSCKSKLVTWSIYTEGGIVQMIESGDPEQVHAVAALIGIDLTKPRVGPNYYPPGEVR